MIWSCDTVILSCDLTGSLSFNGEGRYHSEGDYVKLVYGAFSGPL